MSEPVSGGVGIFAGFKAIGGVPVALSLAAFLSALVVMCTNPPESRKEWFVAITSTVVSSICGGSYLVMRFGLQDWTLSYFGLSALFGLVFACGLPGWALVRWVFNFIRSKEGMTILEVAHDVVDDVKDIKEKVL
jgi:hypothetical protein